MMAIELNYSNSSNLTKTFTHWQLDEIKLLDKCQQNSYQK